MVAENQEGSDSTTADSEDVQARGRYVLVDRLYADSQHETFVAYDRSAGAGPLVVQRMQPEAARVPEDVQAFLTLAGLWSRLEHSVLCRIEDYGVFDGVPYIARQYLAGKSLHDVQRRHAVQRRLVHRPLALRIISETCSAMVSTYRSASAPRSSERLGCDAQPRKIILGFDGQVKLVGLRLESGETADGSRRDVVQLASTCYQLLCGHPAYPEAAEDPPGSPPPLAERGVSVPEGLDGLLAQAFDGQVGGSWSSSVAFVEQLQGCLAAGPEVAATADEQARLMQLMFREGAFLERERAHRVTQAGRRYCGTGPSLPVVPAAESDVIEDAQREKGTRTEDAAPALVLPSSEPMAALRRLARGKSVSLILAVAGLLLLVTAVLYVALRQAVSQQRLSSTEGEVSDEAAAALPSSGPGMLQIVSDAPAHVYLDGAREKLLTPVNRSLSAGSHSVTIVFPSTGKKLEREIRVQAGGVIRLRLRRRDLDTGRSPTRSR